MKKPNFITVLIGFVVVVGIFSVIKHFYMQPDYEHGEKAPDFISMLPDGKAFNLSQLQGQYVLLDFWGSWCGPCIRESPALVSIYNKYKGKSFKNASGFTIVSVAIDKDKVRWAKTVERLGLNWPYQLLDPVSSFKFFDSPIANEYGVKQVPTKFLIDEKGQIVSVDATMEEIDRFLQDRM